MEMFRSTHLTSGNEHARIQRKAALRPTRDLACRAGERHLPGRIFMDVCFSHPFDAKSHQYKPAILREIAKRSGGHW